MKINRVPKLIFLFCLICFLACNSAKQNSNSSPSATVKEMIQLQKDKNFEGYVEYLAVDDKVKEKENWKVGLINFIRKSDEISSTINGNIVTFEILNETIDPSNPNIATVLTKVTYDNSEPFELEYPMVKVEGKWKYKLTNK